MPRYFKVIAITLLLVFFASSGFAQMRRLGFFINAAGFFPTQKNINVGYGSGIGGIFYLIIDHLIADSPGANCSACCGNCNGP